MTLLHRVAFLGLVVVALCFLLARGQGACAVQGLRLTIRPPRGYRGRCNSTSLVTFGCRGGCSSYTQLSVDDSTRIYRYCSCCEPTRYGIQIVHLPCRAGVPVRLPVKFAIECHCRPCSLDRPSSIVRLRQLLARTRRARVTATD